MTRSPHPAGCLRSDHRDGHAAKEVGIGYGRLLQSYGIHKTIREACLAWERDNLGPPNPDAQRPAITLPNLNP